MNYLMIESLQRFHHYFGDELQVEFPTGSGVKMNLGEVACQLSRRLSHLFLRDEHGRRPVFGGAEKFQSDPHFRDHILFYEYFHGDNGAGLGPAIRPAGPRWWRSCCNRAASSPTRIQIQFDSRRLLGFHSEDGQEQFFPPALCAFAAAHRRRIHLHVARHPKVRRPRRIRRTCRGGVYRCCGSRGIIETIGGPLIFLGLFTRPVAFILCGEMAVAYFTVHIHRASWAFPLLNGGEITVLYCFIYLYLVTAGPGAISLDGALRGKA